MKIRSIVSGLALAAIIGVVGCTAAQQQTAKTVTASATAVCEVVFTAADPALTPLCTTAESVALAIESLEAQAQTTVAPDAGAAARKLAAATPVVPPSNAQVYAWLVAHGAKGIAK